MADLTMQRGRTQVIGMSLTDDDGEEFTVESTDVLTFGFKVRGDTAPVFSKAVTGTSTITLSPSDTADIDPGTYLYDISLTRGSDIYPVVALSKLKLIDNVV